jgi:hypothetical protein
MIEVEARRKSKKRANWTEANRLRNEFFLGRVMEIFPGNLRSMVVLETRKKTRIIHSKSFFSTEPANRQQTKKMLHGTMWHLVGQRINIEALVITAISRALAA